MVEISEDLLKLGILQEPLLDEEASIEAQPKWLVFPNKLFQEYWAGYYASKCIALCKSEVNGMLFNHKKCCYDETILKIFG